MIYELLAAVAHRIQGRPLRLRSYKCVGLRLGRNDLLRIVELLRMVALGLQVLLLGVVRLERRGILLLLLNWVVFLLIAVLSIEILLLLLVLAMIEALMLIADLFICV